MHSEVNIFSFKKVKFHFIVGTVLDVLICCSAAKVLFVNIEDIEVPCGSCLMLFLLIVFISRGILRDRDRTMITYVEVLGRF